MDISTFSQGHAQAWLNLALVPGIGPKTIKAIEQSNLSPIDVYSLDPSQKKQLGLNQKVIEYLQKYPPNRPSREVEKTLSWAEKDAHYLLTLQDDKYPQRLRQIASVPPLLMVKGRVDALQHQQLAIVGSRYPTPAGEQQAFDFASALTDMGLTITSGLAKGVDACAHQGALQAQGSSIAVLGNGLNEIYPKQNSQLSEELCEKGAIISEFGLWTKPHPGHFPRRNRIVSGLSMGTLVVEATLKSGSLITARQALEQNREVFAIPGPINNPQKAGCHYLIRQGATLIESPEQIIEELQWQSEHTKTASLKPQEVNLDISFEQQRLIKSLDYEGANLDELVNRSHMPIHEISVLLMELELTGLVRQTQGNYSLI
jgi:DNA processing protein